MTDRSVSDIGSGVLLKNNVHDEIPERNAGMTIRAVVFDIGGVLEITPRTGWVEKWEARVH